MKSSSRNYFRNWVSKQPNPGWNLMPLTHISGGFGAQDIVSSGTIETRKCKVMNEELIYSFYGRAGYRVGETGAINLEGYCPFCFVLDGNLLNKSEAIFPFDTGAYENRIFKPYMGDSVSYSDFEISHDTSLPNKLISTVFQNKENYFNADKAKINDKDTVSSAGDMHVQSYISLISAPNRNGPDDRVSSIEVLFSKNINISQNLKAIIVPHTLWNNTSEAEWLKTLAKSNIEIATYAFYGGRSADHYHALIETELRQIFQKWNVLA